MTTLHKRTHTAHVSISASEVEHLIAQAAESATEPVEWHLDLSAAQHVQPLAGARLASCLGHLARHRLVVTLPPPGGGSRFRVLHRSGLLPAVADHAHEVVGEPDQTLERLRREPSATISVPNLLLFNRVDDGALVPDKNRFAARLWSAMGRALPAVERGLDRPTREALTEGGYEGIANVVDHAFGRPSTADPSRRIAFCMLTMQEELSANPDDPLGLAAYHAQAKRQLRQRNLRWFTMTVVDGGNGIPARHGLDAQIYDGPFAEEERLLAEALERGTSIKLAAGDAQLRGDPGWGLSLIANALEKARGYACIRTGRHLVELDAFASTRGWQLRPEVLAPLHGTVLQLLLPVEDPQLSFD